MTPKLLILLFSTLLYNTSLAQTSVDITCEFSTRENLDYMPSEEYTCTLKTDFLYIEDTTVDKIVGNHTDGKSAADVNAIFATDLKILRLPKLAAKFSNIKLIYITKSPLRQLRKDDIASYKDKLERLAVTDSQIEILDNNLFSENTNLMSINFKNNKIFYIADSAFDGPEAFASIFLDGNGCKVGDLNITSCNGPDNCTSFIDNLNYSTCKLPEFDFLLAKYQTTKVELDLRYYISSNSSNNDDNDNSELQEQLDAAKKDLAAALLKYNQTVANLTDCVEKSSTSLTEISNLKKDIANLNVRIQQLEAETEKCSPANGTCRYSIDSTYGYSCTARNISVKIPQEIISWTGTHNPSNKSNEDIDALIIRNLDVEAVPMNIVASFPNLINFIINNCGVKKLEKLDFDKLFQLKNIDLAGNQIATIDAGTFDVVTALTELNLSQNIIKSLPSNIFAKLTALKSLNLNKNQLAFLKSDILSTAVAIKTFTAAENKISTIDNAIAWQLRNADLIDFTGNPCGHKYDKTAADSFIDFYYSIIYEC